MKISDMITQTPPVSIKNPFQGRLVIVDSAVATPPPASKVELPSLKVAKNWIEPTAQAVKLTPFKEMLIKRIQSNQQDMSSPMSGLLTLQAIAQAMEEVPPSVIVSKPPLQEGSVTFTSTTTANASSTKKDSIRKPSFGMAHLPSQEHSVVKPVLPSPLITLAPFQSIVKAAGSMSGSSTHSSPASTPTSSVVSSPSEYTTSQPLVSRGTCKYKTGKCTNERAMKINGKLHNLCEHHRMKQNNNQRKLDRKIRERRGSNGDLIGEVPATKRRKLATLVA